MRSIMVLKISGAVMASTIALAVNAPSAVALPLLAASTSSEIATKHADDRGNKGVVMSSAHSMYTSYAVSYHERSTPVMWCNIEVI